VQSVDALPLLEHILQHKNDKIGENATFGIGKKNTSIPETMFQCDMNSREKCIPPKNIVGGNKDIIGSQYRTVSCFWGNMSCPGFRNLKQKQDICVDPYIRDNFCSDTYPSSWEPWPTNIRWRNNGTYTERHIFAKFERKNEESCFILQNVEKCDSGLWSKWIQGIGVSYNRAKRYCHLPNLCIFEERM